MSQNTPSRPLPAYIYRRRRLAVFGGLTLVLLVVLVLWHPWSSGTRGPKPSDALIPATSAPANAAGLPADAACAPRQVKVSAFTDKAAYAAGEYPQLTVGVENMGSTSCTLNVGTSQQVFTITSGSEMFWVSTDCQTESSDFDLVLEPGQSVQSEPIQWDRTRSNPGTCTIAQRDPVPAAGASYHLTVTVGGISSNDSSQFTLN